MRHNLLKLLALFLIVSCETDNNIPVNQEEPEDPEEPQEQVLFPCENGMAGDYPCNGYDLASYFSLEELTGISEEEQVELDITIEGNDSWGWTSPNTGREYALVGHTEGTTFVDITNPIEPVILGNLPTATSRNSWRDIKVYNNTAYIVSEAGGHGMQVFDLTQLETIEEAPQAFTANTVFNGFGSAHNIVINEASGFAYAVGTDTHSGGAHFINIQDPLNPVDVGGYSGSGYTHDAQVVNYNGPDTDYTEHEIYIGSNENRIVIVDVTDKENPQFISEISYDNVGYTHQGWFTDDMTYFILGDEIDEMAFGNNTRTLVFDFSDLDNPTYFMDYLGETQAIDHNGYVDGNAYYQASYTAGFRVLDISGIAEETITETAFFDTYPENDATAFNGAWNVYPFFPSGTIIVSNIDRGLFILTESE